jgi:hypothetical protein
MGQDLCCYLRTKSKDQGRNPSRIRWYQSDFPGLTKTIKDRCRRNSKSYLELHFLIEHNISGSQQLSSRRETDRLSIPPSFIARLVPIFKIWEYSGESIPQSVQNGQCIPALPAPRSEMVARTFRRSLVELARRSSVSRLRSPSPPEGELAPLLSVFAPDPPSPTPGCQASARLPETPIADRMLDCVRFASGPLVQHQAEGRH